MRCPHGREVVQPPAPQLGSHRVNGWQHPRPRPRHHEAGVRPRPRHGAVQRPVSAALVGEGRPRPRHHHGVHHHGVQHPAPAPAPSRHHGQVHVGAASRGLPQPVPRVSLLLFCDKTRVGLKYNLTVSRHRTYFVQFGSIWFVQHFRITQSGVWLGFTTYCFTLPINCSPKLSNLWINHVYGEYKMVDRRIEDVVSGTYVTLG